MSLFNTVINNCNIFLGKKVPMKAKARRSHPRRDEASHLNSAALGGGGGAGSFV